MHGHAVAHGADDAVFVRDSGKIRHEFADVETGSCCGDGFVGTAQVGWGVWFGVPGIELAESTVLEHEDTGFG